MHVHGVAPLLQVFDMPTAIRFYRDVLGFKVWATSEPGDDCNWARIKLNGAEVMLNTAYEADRRPPQTLHGSPDTTTLVCSSAARISMPLTSTCVRMASM